MPVFWRQTAKEKKTFFLHDVFDGMVVSFGVFEHSVIPECSESSIFRNRENARR